MFIDKAKKDDVIGVIQFITSREDFYKTGSAIIKQFHYRMTFPKSKDDFDIIKKFGECKMFLVGIKDDVEYNQLWFVKPDTETIKEFEAVSCWNGNIVNTLQETAILLNKETDVK